MRISWRGVTRPAMLVALLLPGAAPGLGAQTADELPAIVVRGDGRVELEPDYAEVALGVEVQAATADSAASEMSSRLAAVADTLADLGLPPDSFPRTAFAVSPRYDFEEAQQLVGFTAQVSVTIRTSRLADLPEFIGASLAAGATRVGDVRFLSTSSEEARLQALAEAYADAQREAEALAVAAGGSLGPIVRIETQPTGGPYYTAPAWSMARISPIAVQLQEVVIEASVTVRWLLERD